MEKQLLDHDLSQLETVEIGWWPTPEEAEICSQKLWGAGIPSIRTSQTNVSTMLPSFENRVGVFVRQRDFVAAMAVLSEKSEGEIEDELLAARETEMAKNRRNQRLFVLFLKGLFALVGLFLLVALGLRFFKN